MVGLLVFFIIVQFQYEEEEEEGFEVGLYGESIPPMIFATLLFLLYSGVLDCVLFSTYG